jgi:mono/diheme cytochrome c family protein
MTKYLLMIWTALWAGAAFAQVEGDPEAGKLLAEQYCARCHDVSADGGFKQMPPSFAAIAVYWGDDQIWNRTMFPIHTGMPSMWEFLMPENVAHVTAYIRSLEER